MSEWTKERIASTRAFCDAATPGPWRFCGDGECECRMGWSIPLDEQVFTAKANSLLQIGTAKHKWGDGPDLIYGEVPIHETYANAAFIAAARSELPAALNEIERCHAKLLTFQDFARKIYWDPTITRMQMECDLDTLLEPDNVAVIDAAI